ncbi:MAG: hypothetical protein FWD62_00980 [Betaproteobacteria bacterium]|nr:hypothetical protein [Betaproteobacteria bacterium]
MSAAASLWRLSWHTALTALLACLALLGCATSQIQSQWFDPAFANHALSGARVLIVCDAAELSLKRNCQELMSGQLRALGAVPVVGADTLQASTGGASDTLLEAARTADARAVLSVLLVTDTTVFGAASPAVSLGVGGGSWGSGGTSFGGGLGVSLPIGGGDRQVNTALGAYGALNDVASGRLMWAAKLVASASSNLNAQIAELAGMIRTELQKAGFF